MPSPGALIGPYRLLSVLGRGAMGVVWRARDERLDRLVALKLLPRDQASTPERRARMIREAKAAAAIPHRNVVTLYDIVSEDGEDILVMELVEGQTVAQRLKSGGPLELSGALDILYDLCDALAAAHARGVLHRDVKAANVMLSDDGTVKVLDFGLAKLRGAEGEQAPESTTTQSRGSAGPLERSHDELALDETVSSVDERRISATMEATGSYGSADLLVTQAGQLLGTPLYMAPEQFIGEPPTEATEVFSVGVVAYELLAARPPFRGADFAELEHRVLNEAPAALPEGTDAEVAELINTALAKDPDERFADMASFRDRVDEIRTRLGAPGRRSAWALIAAMTAAAAVAAVVVAVWLSGRAADPAPASPGDQYVDQAFREYNLFYNQKAAASLRAGERVAPDHPRVYAYQILFGAASGAELDKAIAEGQRVRREAELDGADRALLEAALASATEGPARARAALVGSGATLSGELAFWAAELAYRARDYEAAEREFRAVLAAGDPVFRGRIYDHFSAVLAYAGKPDEALEIGRLYAEAFAGEPDAVGVYATALAGAGKLEEALGAAREARRLYEGEDTVAGLAKVHAYRGELAEARVLYRKSAAMAPESRRPIRRAALAYLAWIEGDDDEARREVTECLPGGDDAEIWERGPCLWVAGVVWPDKSEAAITELEALAAAGTPLRPPYGFPVKLANLLRARQLHFGGACRRDTSPAPIPADQMERVRALLGDGRDFFAQYHIPFFAEYASCELDALER